MPNMLPASQWLTLTDEVWLAERDTLLCSDAVDPDAGRELLLGSDFAPDSFAVAERFTAPEWLDAAERDGDRWLSALVARRVAGIPALRGDRAGHEAAHRHVLDQVCGLLDRRDATGRTIAESMWNQEVPYVVDRVAALCLLGDAAADLDAIPKAIVRSNVIALDLLDRLCYRLGDRLDRLDTAELLRIATAAGLLDLSIKGGPADCTPINLTNYMSTVTTSRVVSELLAAARNPGPVNHTESLLAAVDTGSTRLVWFTDDLMETAFDLVVVARLLDTNPALTVTIVPRSRRADNDATHRDIGRLLQHRALQPLAKAVVGGRATVTPRGPSMATVNPLKLHPAAVEELRQADAVFIKGGRSHELLAGTLDRPQWTAYVLVREFNESQAGYDSRSAPLLLVHSPAGDRPWWGWRGRAHRTLAVAPDRVVAAAWTTLSDRHRRTTTTDPAVLSADLAGLLESWPTAREHYAPQARAELSLAAGRLGQLSTDPRDHQLIQRVHDLTTPAGASTS